MVVRDLIGQHLCIDAEKVTDAAAFRDDLSADSLDAFDLLLAFEETFGIEIPDNEADSMPRVGDASPATGMWPLVSFTTLATKGEVMARRSAL